ncbi:hypothetical protein ACN47E_004251 [Coniothyrium glycines]
MPNYTPSPHRFLAPSAPPPKSKPKPQSGLRTALHVQTPKAETTRQEAEPQFKKLTPAKRFVVTSTPHAKSFSAASVEPPKESSQWANPTTSTSANPRPKVVRKFERVESIEFSSQSSLAATQDNPIAPSILPSTERDLMFSSSPPSASDQSERPEDDEMLFDAPSTPHKRRRLGTPVPQTPSSRHNPTTHRFKLPAAPTHPATPSLATSLAMTAARPHFLLPTAPTSPPKYAKPLPEIFSPSRKVGRHVANGLASTMTSWIIEMANTAADHGIASTMHGRENDDGVRLKVRVRAVSSGDSTPSLEDEVVRGMDKWQVECCAGGVVFVRGDTQPGLYNASRAAGEDGEIRVLLAGVGGVKGKESVRLGEGSVVGIRAPMWNVDVGRERWTVGVDWVVM